MRFGLLVAGILLVPQDREAMQAIERLKKSKKVPSTSVGKPQDGRLEHGMEMPVSGCGYRYVNPKRGRNWGTDETVFGLMHLAAEFMERHPGHPGLRFGDVSQKGGGEVSNHGSHESGRDVDIIFLAADEGGRPVDHGEFLSFDAGGKRGALRMDLARNWDLVALMLENRYWGKDIKYVFISTPQRKLLLEHAKERLAKESSPAKRAALDALIRRAERLLQHWRGHDDHFHLRIG